MIMIMNWLYIEGLRQGDLHLLFLLTGLCRLNIIIIIIIIIIITTTTTTKG